MTIATMLNSALADVLITPLPEPEEARWRPRAACLGADTELFMPWGREGSPGFDRQVAQARQVCAGCPVRWDCLTDALDVGDDHAIRGGTTPGQRRVLRVGLLRAGFVGRAA